MYITWATRCPNSQRMGYGLAQSLMLELVQKRYNDSITWPEDSAGSRNANDPLTIEPLEVTMGISIFPNPNNGTFTIKGLQEFSTETKEQLNLYVFDMVGKQVFHEQVSPAEEMSITLPKDLKGAYNMLIQNSQGTKYSTKLILNE